MYSIIDTLTGAVVATVDTYAEALARLDRCERWALLY